LVAIEKYFSPIHQQTYQQRHCVETTAAAQKNKKGDQRCRQPP
jgi:hypothetical protein